MIFGGKSPLKQFYDRQDTVYKYIVESNELRVAKEKLQTECEFP
jgi:hypothetical protein